MISKIKYFRGILSLNSPPLLSGIFGYDERKYDNLQLSKWKTIKLYQELLRT